MILKLILLHFTSLLITKVSNTEDIVLRVPSIPLREGPDKLGEMVEIAGLEATVVVSALWELDMFGLIPIILEAFD